MKNEPKPIVDLMAALEKSLAEAIAKNRERKILTTEQTTHKVTP